MKKFHALLAVLLTLALLLPATALAEEPAAPDYNDEVCWAYRESGESDKPADVFFIAPAVYGGKEGYNMALDSAKQRVKFVGAIDMEKGIYDDEARFFAPYYRQYALAVVQLPREDWKPYEDLAFADVKAAFETYMAEEYPAKLFFLEDGMFHIYDYQFFYRNLEKNVQTRLEAFLARQAETTDLAA